MKEFTATIIVKFIIFVIIHSSVIMISHHCNFHRYHIYHYHYISLHVVHGFHVMHELYFGQILSKALIITMMRSCAFW
jgi:hypothetical protein